MLAVTDDDCVPDSGWVSALREAFDDPIVDAVAGSVEPLDDEGSPEGYALSSRVGLAPHRFTVRRPPWRVGTGGNFAGRVELLRAAGGWDSRLGTGSPGRAGEDIELIDRLLNRGAVVDRHPEAVVRHARVDRERRLATRWTYGHGIGAFLGMRIRRRDAAVLPMAFDYLRMNAVAGLLATGRRDWFVAGQHGRSLAALVPGIRYGFGLVDAPPALEPGLRPDGRGA